MRNEVDWDRVLTRMGEDRAVCCVNSVFVLGLVLFGLGSIGYGFGSKAFLYIALAGVALWLLLICCGWTIMPSYNPFLNRPTCVYCSVILLLALVFATSIIFTLLESSSTADNKVVFDVADASLTRFGLSSDDTSSLDYNLRVDIVVRPNTKKHGMYYETFHAWASYQGSLFASLSLPPFYHNSSEFALPPLLFHGHRDQLPLPPGGLKRYRKEEATGQFGIAVTLSYLGFRTTGLDENGTTMVKDRHHHLKGLATFDLKVHLLVNESSGELSAL